MHPGRYDGPMPRHGGKLTGVIQVIPSDWVTMPRRFGLAVMNRLHDVPVVGGAIGDSSFFATACRRLARRGPGERDRYARGTRGESSGDTGGRRRDGPVDAGARLVPTFAVVLPTGKAHLPADRIRDDRTPASTAVGAGPFVEEVFRWLPDSPEDA